MTSCQQIWSNSEAGFQTHSIYVKLTFSLIVTFCLIKTDNRTKKSQTQLSYYCFHTDFLQKKC